MAADIQETPFVKQLAANDRPTRDAALLSLRTYLSAPRSFTPLDLLKLWKGLFYSMWMCDRPRPQATLASDLASLPSLLPPSNRIPFLRAFWLTMAREWTNIDVLRMEKFLLLTRRYLAAMFGLMRDGGWGQEVVEEGLALLQEIPLNMKDFKLPNGMRYHVIDVYVDELERVDALKEETKRVDVEVLLGPLRWLASGSPTKGVRNKCKEALLDERLPGNKHGANEGVQEDVEAEGSDEEWGGISD